MDVERIEAGVHRFGDGIVNAYALSDGDEVTLVDCLYPGELPQLVHALGRIGHGLADVRAVLLTHGHLDHLGVAERLRAEHDIPAYADPAEFRRLSGGHPGNSPLALSLGVLPSLLLRPHAWRFLVHGLRHGLLRPEWLRAVEPLEDGEQLDVPGRPVVVSTPGHTEGHVAFDLPGIGATITGDALTTVNVLTGGHGPQIEALTQDPARADRSLDRFLALDRDLLLPGHGPPWRGSVREAVAHARRTATRSARRSQD